MPRGNCWWAGRTVWHLQAVANYLGDWEASVNSCLRGLDHGTALQDIRLKAVGWTRMGLAHIQQGDIERGLECCNEALALAPLPRDAAGARVILGHGKIKAGRLDEGIAELSEGLAWFEGAHTRGTQPTGAAGLAQACRPRGAPAAARALLERGP